MLHYTEAIGLDIGSHAAKAVHVRRRWGCVCIENEVWVRLPEDPEERLRVLRSFVTKNGWRDLPCVVAPPVDGVMLQTIRVAADDPRPIQSIIEVELSQLSGLSEATTVRDYKVFRKKHTTDILLAVARTDGVQNAIDLAAECGLHPVQVTPQATALYNTVLRHWKGNRKARFVIVDVGHRRTTVLVGTRTGILDARHVPSGANTFAEGIRELGAEDHASGTAEMDRWIEALQSCLAISLEVDGDDGTTTDIILTGAGTYITGIKERLATRLGRTIRSLGEVSSSTHVEEIERMALARGLALAGMGIGRVRLTLLPPATEEAITLHSQSRYWLASGLALIAAMLILLTGAHIELWQKRSALSEARARRDSLVASEQTLNALQQQTDALNGRVKPFSTLVHNGTIVRTVIGALSRARQEQDWLQRIADVDSYFLGEDASLENIPVIDHMIAEGHTPAADLSGVQAMIETLRNSPGILEADLLADDAIQSAEEELPQAVHAECQPFAIELVLPTP